MKNLKPFFNVILADVSKTLFRQRFASDKVWSHHYGDETQGKALYKLHLRDLKTFTYCVLFTHAVYNKRTSIRLNKSRLFLFFVQVGRHLLCKIIRLEFRGKMGSSIPDWSDQSCTLFTSIGLQHVQREGDNVFPTRDNIFLMRFPRQEYFCYFSLFIQNIIVVGGL